MRYLQSICRGIQIRYILHRVIDQRKIQDSGGLHSNLLLRSLLFMHLRMLLATFAVKMHGWLRISLLLTGAFPTGLSLASRSVLSLYRDSSIPGQDLTLVLSQFHMVAVGSFLLPA